MGLGKLVRGFVLGAGMFASSLGCSDNDNKDVYNSSIKNSDVTNLPLENIYLIYYEEPSSPIINFFEKFYDKNKKGVVCRATLIDEDKFLTAKHCVKPYLVSFNFISDNVKKGFPSKSGECIVDSIDDENSLDVAIIDCENSFDLSNKVVLSKDKLNIGDGVSYCTLDGDVLVGVFDKTKYGFDIAYDENSNKYCFYGKVVSSDGSLIKTNLPVRQGYSGSAIFNDNGEIVGVMSSIEPEFSFNGVFRAGNRMIIYASMSNIDSL
jgi:V8-like Glu-specific endopeptidase